MEPDNRENVEVDLSDDEFLSIAKLAHERDITFNQMVEIILMEAIKQFKQNDNIQTEGP